MADKVLTVLHKNGRAAYPNGVEPEPKARTGLTIKSYDGRPDSKAFEKLNQLIEEGPFIVHISRTFPLEKAADAQRALAEHHLGKIALRP